MDARRQLDDLLAMHRAAFIEAAQKLSEHYESWDLGIPCVVIDGRQTPTKATVTPVGSIGGIVPSSAAIDIPEIKEWIRLVRENGHEDAFSEMLNRRGEEVGCRFAEGYGQLQTERHEGNERLWSANELSRFVVMTRECFPHAVCGLALLPGEDGGPHSLVSFECDVRALLE